MLSLPLEIHTLIDDLLPSSSRACFNMVCKSIITKRTKSILLAEQALKDGYYNIFLFAIEFQPLLSRYYTAAVQGNVLNAIQFLKENGIKQPYRLPLECVRHDREEIFTAINPKYTGVYARKCAAFGRSWLPRQFRMHNPESRALFKYAVRYNNLLMVKRLVPKCSQIDIQKALHYAKTHKLTEIFELLMEGIDNFKEDFIWFIDDVSLLERIKPDWRDSYLETIRSPLWVYCSFELLRYATLDRYSAIVNLRNETFPEDRIDITYNTQEHEDWFHIMLQEICAGYTIKSLLREVKTSNHKHEYFNYHSHLLFFACNYERLSNRPKELGGLPQEYDLLNTTLTSVDKDYVYRRRKKFCKYIPHMCDYFVMDNEEIQRHYDYCPECFLREDIFLTLLKYGGPNFVYWCEKKNIAYNKRYVYTIAIDYGEIDLLNHILTTFTPNFNDFLYACKNFNPKAMSKCIKNWELCSIYTKKGDYKRQCILIVYDYVKDLLVENANRLADFCSVSTLLYMKQQGILPRVKIQSSNADKERIFDW